MSEVRPKKEEYLQEVELRCGVPVFLCRLERCPALFASARFLNLSRVRSRFSAGYTQDVWSAIGGN